MRSVSSGLEEMDCWLQCDVLDVFGRNSLHNFGEAVYYRLATARAVASGVQPQLYVGRYLGHHARIGSILITTIDGVMNVAGFRRMNEEN